MANYSVQVAYLKMKAFGECLFGLDTSWTNTLTKKRKSEPKEKVDFSQKSQNSIQRLITKVFLYLLFKLVPSFNWAFK